MSEQQQKAVPQSMVLLMAIGAAILVGTAIIFRKHLEF